MVNNPILHYDALGDSVIKVIIRDEAGFVHGSKSFYIDHTFYITIKKFLADVGSSIYIVLFELLKSKVL